MDNYKLGEAPWEVNKQKFPLGQAPWEIPEEPTLKEPNYFQRVGTEFSNIGQDIVSGIKEGIKPFQFKEFKEVGRPIRAGLRIGGGITRGAFAPIFQAPGIKQLTEKVIEKVIQIPGAHNLIKEATDIAIKYPNAAKDLRDVVDIATLGIGGFAEKPLLQGVKAIGKDISSGVKVLLTPSETAIQNKILTLFQKSIKPTAKKTLTQAERYNTNTINALRAIKANADKLNIEDATGELVSRTPQTINEFAQGIDQTKKLVFDQYDILAKQAGDAGAVIDAKPIATEVESVAQNKALQITNPEIIKYAQNWAERLREFDVLDTQTTQEVIRLMNNNLQTFYKNPTYESASKVAIDAGIANNFRKSLDDAIEGATGEQYQALKNQYSALKAIENDVVRASMRDARKNTKGLLDYTDIFTGGQMIGGILSLNPAMFSKGAIERGVKEYIKFLNDPNRAVANIFEKLNIETTKPFEPISAIGKFLKEPKIGLSIENVSKNQEFQRFQSINKSTPKTTNNIKNISDTTISQDIMQPLAQEAQTLRGTKGMTAQDIMKTYPDIKLTRDVPATDIYGNKVKIPDGEVLTPYEMKGNKILLQDGETYVVSKNQFENIKGQSISKEAKPFAPELVGTEEVVKGTTPKIEVKKTSRGWETYLDGKLKGTILKPELTESQALQVAKENAGQHFIGESATKYSQYQLPGGKNYKEILIKAPIKPPVKVGDMTIRDTGDFKSSHWNEPNVISHLRMNERTYQGKKVAFMEELQSDWARLARQSKDFELETGLKTKTLQTPLHPLLKNWQEPTVKRALQEAVDSKAEYFSWISGEQTSARYNLATQVENVEWNTFKNTRSGTPYREVGIQPKGSTTGKIWFDFDDTGKITTSDRVEWKGKKLDEVLGKGLADKIMGKETGTLSGEGLKFGGEWANNLYDKQVADIVRNVTGAKIEKLDMGLPIDVKTIPWYESGYARPDTALVPNDLKIGMRITKGGNESDYIITDILGDGKFKAVEKRLLNENEILIIKDGRRVVRDIPDEQTFDISVKKSPYQLGIKLTPEIKAKIKGKAPKFGASGKQ